jgi:ABC-type glycerol-3-phosphate transport system permease component
MLLIALDPDEGDIEFECAIWPADPSLHSFHTVLTQGYWLVADFWRQLGNSFFIAVMTMALTVVAGSLASFALSRMRVGRRWWLVRRIVIGISTGSADITAATPSDGGAASKV